MTKIDTNGTLVHMSDFNELPVVITRGEWDDLRRRVTELEAAEKIRSQPSTELVVNHQGTITRTTKTTRGTRLPENWEPHLPTVQKMVIELRVSSDVLRREHPRFVDHFLSAPGAKGVKLDWDRTWCNWMRTAADRGQLGRITGTVGDKVTGWLELNVDSGGQ